MTPNSTWKKASSCCVLQIAAADGIIYGIGEDNRIHHQADLFMTPDSEWLPASSGPVVSIAIRGDTIYGIDADGFTHEQRLSQMTTTSKWNPSFFEDALYPSKKYLSIFAHNDIMYACGRNMVVYSKLIAKPVVY